MQVLVEKIIALLSDDNRAQVAQVFGASDVESLKSSLSGAIGPILKQLEGREGGVSGLIASLDRNGDGSVADDIIGHLFSGSSNGNGAPGGLMGLLTGFIDGGKSQTEGLSQVFMVLPVIAPVALKALRELRAELNDDVAFEEVLGASQASNESF